MADARMKYIALTAKHYDGFSMRVPPAVRDSLRTRHSKRAARRSMKRLMQEGFRIRNGRD